MVYGLQELCQDAPKRCKHSRTTFDDQVIKEVWVTLDRYVLDCLDHGRGISIPSLFTLTWAARKANGRPASALHCVFSDAFLRNANLTGHVSFQTLQNSQLEGVTVEDFNFSKAAIRFSRQLTKDHIFTGIKALSQQLAEVVSQGRQLSLEMTVGTLQSTQERGVAFAFSPSFVERHALPIPDVTAIPAKPEVLSFEDPNMGDNTVSAAPAEISILLAGLDGTRARGSSFPSHAGTAISDVATEASSQSRVGGAAQLAAYKEAMGREMARLEKRASEAMRHQRAACSLAGTVVQRSQEETRIEEVERQQAMQEQARFNFRQMQEKRKQRASAIAHRRRAGARDATKPLGDGCDAAFAIGEELRLPLSARGHAQPRSTPTMTPLSARVRTVEPGQLKLPRECLDEQVEAKRLRNEAQKQAEDQLELSLLEAERERALFARHAMAVARTQERQDLLTAWDDSIRVQEVRRHIEAIDLGKGRVVRRSVSERRGPSCRMLLETAGSFALQQSPQRTPANG